MKIILTHSYFLENDPNEMVIMKPYPPLGILSISAYLHERGMKNELYDTTFSTKSKQRDYLLAQVPDVLGIYANLMTKVNVIELIKFIHKEYALRNTKIIIGGPDVRYNIESYLGAGADICVIGEGEISFFELCEAYQIPNNPWIDHIQGIAYKNMHNEIFQSPEREKIKDIDSLPFPNRAGIDIARYMEVWKKHHGASAISMSTQRGCPYTCKWCSTAVYGQSYRRRSPQLVVEEMQLLKTKYNPDTIWFVDDVFTVSHKWLAGFNEALKQANIKIPYECITRADRLSPEVIQLMKESGCYRVWIGAESGSQKIIDLMDRRVDVVKVREMIQCANAAGIETGTFIMLGYPGETNEDVEETINHLVAANPKYFTITIAYPIKGTSLYNETLPSHTSPDSWENITDRAIDFERTYPRRYYEYAVRYVTNEVHYQLGRTKTPKSKQLIKRVGHKLRSYRGQLGMLLVRNGLLK